jgi:inner membrane protein
MNPVTHFLAGWLIANVDHLERRDRVLVTLASVIPDADGLGIISDIAIRDQGRDLVFYGQYHHVLAHNLVFGLLLAAASYALSKKRGLTTFLVLLGFHIHLMGDLLSGRGPDGTIWTISYLFPVLKHIQFSWSGQWELNSWPNVVITATTLMLTLYLAWRRGFSPVNIISIKADEAVVVALRSRFPGQRT